MTARPRGPAWTRAFPVDPVPLLSRSDEPAARWMALTALLDRPASDPDVVTAHADVLADPLTADLLDRLTPWDSGLPLSGHNVPAFGPNLIGLLADLGVTAADTPRIGAALETMLAHQADDGRFLAYGRVRGQPEAVWAALPCDSHAVLETLLRSGFADDPRVRRAVDACAAALTATSQGPGWLCRPDPDIPFRGPGRRGDVCPQVTLEALRAFSYLPEGERPTGVIDAGRTVLRVWRDRGAHQPYQFGHGRGFKRGKWPATWYSALAVTDTLGRYPRLWDDTGADPVDRRSMAEIAACLVAYNVGADGRVVPRSAFRGFEAHSFGQKKQPSDVALAQVAIAVRRLEPLVDEIAGVDVLTLGSSKGGAGTPLPP